MKSLIMALNIAYNESESRSFLQLNAMGLLFALGTIFLIIIFLVFIMALPTIVEHFIASETIKSIALIGRWILAAFLCIFSLGIVYRWGPKRSNAEWIWVTWGAFISTILLILASVLFSVYIQNFNAYNATYGSLASAVIFMLWLYYTMLIILIGAKINAEMEHQTRIDTTTGKDREMGERGAHVADTLGRTYTTSDDVDESE
jgi:membrane protein